VRGFHGRWRRGGVVTRYGVMTAVGRIIGATRYYGYFSPFEHELYNYNGPYYDDGDSLEVQPASNDVAPDASTSLIMSVQKELAPLGYYHCPRTALPARRLNGQSVGSSQAVTCRNRPD
jgi:hypothetical protein